MRWLEGPSRKSGTRRGRRGLRPLDLGPTRRPDSQFGFGYKTAWLAVRADTSEPIVRALRLTKPENVAVREGVDRSYGGGGVFVLQPIDGWVLAVGVDLMIDPPDTVALSSELAAEVQYFASHRVSDAYEWCRADRGLLLRRLISDDQQPLGWSCDGAATPIEVQLGLIDPERDQVGAESIDEGTLLDVAREWSVDPQQLDAHIPSSSVGVWGRLR